MTLVEVREATFADIPALVGLMAEFYAEASFTLDRPWAAAAFGALLEAPASGTAWLGLVDGSVAGHVVLTVRFTMEHGGPSGWIDDLFVRPAWRRHGVARTLVDALVADARRRGCRSLHVEVGADNVPARALYARYGLEPGHDRRVFLSGPLPRR